MISSFLLYSLFASLIISVAGSKRFIFRYDDVEDFYHNTVQAGLLNWFIDNNVGLRRDYCGLYLRRRSSYYQNDK
jgi:hypothetical protein